MKTELLFTFFFLLLAPVASGQGVKNDYLKKVLDDLENVKTASYNLLGESWEPGDTLVIGGSYFAKEYDNPADSTLGVSFVRTWQNSMSCYDGYVRISIDHEQKDAVIDDFTFRKLPFRPITSPFFNHAKNIIKYALSTNDSITVETKETDSDYHFRLVINEDEQIEFFGPACRVPKPPFDLGDPTSIYEIWINKSTGLPYKIRREMSHNISQGICTDAIINQLPEKKIVASDYIPEGYEVRKYGERKNAGPKLDLILMGKKAPDWKLNDATGQEVALSNLKSKVVLISFTGIGCGPCQASIPCLNKFKSDFSSEDLEVVAIETWKRNASSSQNYINRHKISYTFLAATDAVVNDYLSDPGVPAFFILDDQRIVRKVIRGYNTETTGKEIADVVGKLLE